MTHYTYFTLCLICSIILAEGRSTAKPERKPKLISRNTSEHLDDLDDLFGMDSFEDLEGEANEEEEEDEDILGRSDTADIPENECEPGKVLSKHKRRCEREKSVSRRIGNVG